MIDVSLLKQICEIPGAPGFEKPVRDLESVLDSVYANCVAHPDEAENFVKQVYAAFSDEEISNKVAEIVTTAEIRAEVKVIYQTVDNLHKCIPEHSGDWYFTGDYPTTGGTRVVNKAFVNYMEGKTVRAY